MPFLLCSDCGLTTYSAELLATTPECPRCGRDLPTADGARVQAVGDRATTERGVVADVVPLAPPRWDDGRRSLVSAVIDALRRSACVDARRPRP